MNTKKPSCQHHRFPQFRRSKMDCSVSDHYGQRHLLKKQRTEKLIPHSGCPQKRSHAFSILAPARKPFVTANECKSDISIRLITQKLAIMLRTPALYLGLLFISILVLIPSSNVRANGSKRLDYQNRYAFLMGTPELRL